MPVSAQVDMTGVKDTIRHLASVDKELVKEFKAQAAEIAQPAIRAAQESYRQVPLSGMARNWDAKGRSIPPFSVARAQKGVRFKLDYRRNAIGVLLIEQRDATTAIFETAGRATDNRLGRSLNKVASERFWQSVPEVPTRLLGRAVFKAGREGVTEKLRRLILDVGNTIGRRI